PAPNGIELGPLRIAESVGQNKAKEKVISAKIFVGNLNFETTRDELTELLTPVGEIRDVYMPTDRDTGRPRGFAFVEFSTQEEAAQAIEKLNDFELGGRRLRVNEAEERRPQRRPPQSSGGGGGNDFGPDRHGGGPPSKPKGSRKGMRGKKRSL
ncbi:MAG: RNA-binding protein, partial [Acidobacteriota bacterium]|nr:RNA-binding protein [Acidobacteriota bacterium]